MSVYDSTTIVTHSQIMVELWPNCSCDHHLMVDHFSMYLLHLASPADTETLSSVTVTDEYSSAVDDSQKE